MKKLIILFSISIFIYGCSTSNDSNGNSTTTVVPVTPSNLVGNVVTNSKIKLSWTDNSTNETGFIIERKAGPDTYVVVGTTSTDINTFSDTSLTPSTTYTYRVYSNNSAGNSPTYSNELILTTTSIVNLPVLTTIAASSITSTSAISGGIVTNDGGGEITARGVCWSTITNPTIALSTKTIDGSGTGSFISTISSLSANTTYYVRAYATNSIGTNYGDEISFSTTTQPAIDVDGNIYQTVSICNQTWTTTNLNVSKYRNGDIIPQVTDPTVWANLTTGAWRYYGNDSATGATYGKLYNWYAVVDPRGLAPSGYHVPSDVEWTTLTTCLGGDAVAGGKMKEAGTTHWNSPNTDATNESGFTALPGGFLDTSGNFCSIGCEFALGEWGRWWSSTEYSGGARYFGLIYTWGDTRRNFNYKTNGYSVRFLKD